MDSLIEIKVLKLQEIKENYLKEIHTLDQSNSYEDFFYNHMLTNQPCLISNVGDNWLCSKYWIENGSINIKNLNCKYGGLKAPVIDCNVENSTCCKTDMKVSDFLEYLKNERDKLLYLKDWHLRRLCPEDLFYDTPLFFASDWLNEYCIDEQKDDFMFVYIGPENSWTPLHADVYNSYSWSVNVIGQKKWILFPPGEEEKLKDHLGNLPLLFTSKKYENVNYIEVTQEQGDALFVPSGWYHQVFNVKDTISINHNWINGCNIQHVYNALKKCWTDVQNEIWEFRETAEFDSQCTLILKSQFGMDFEDFVKMLCHIARKRLHQLKGNTFKSFDKYIFGNNHIKYDLIKLSEVINNIYSDLVHEKCLPETQIILDDIKQSIQSTL